MPPELAEVRRWMQKAAHDRLTAEAALAQDPPITDTAAFHAQQAVEKLLKAYLTWRQHEFEKTHDLRALVELCADHDAAFLDERDAVEPLTAYAIRFRYPGPADPTAEEVRAALAVVEEVWQFVSGRLPPEVTDEADEA
jgi:HEPN domain-containing protein